MEPNPSNDRDARSTRLGLTGEGLFRLLVAICMIVATVSVAVIAWQERAQTQCAQASANADAWIAVNVVARDFNQPVSLDQNKAAVTAIDKHLHDCLPSGRKDSSANR